MGLNIQIEIERERDALRARVAELEAGVERETLTKPESDLLATVRRWQEVHDRSNSEAVASLLMVARYVLLRFTGKQ